MTSLFSQKTPRSPKPVRVPTERDPSILAAGLRARLAAQGRKGRRETILSESLRGLTGSSGQKLGA